VRARYYLKSVKPEDGEQPDSDLREIVFKKNNYGRVSASVVLSWKDGLFLPVPGMSSLDQAARDQKADELFLKLLRRFTEQGQDLGPAQGINYAPTVFARHQDAAAPGLTFKDFRDAMQRLLDTGKIHVETFGPPSKQRKRVVIT
jgi:hypothetical protein